jgi:hypothetical protein
MFQFFRRIQMRTLISATIVAVLLWATPAWGRNQSKVPGDHHRIEPLGRVVGKTAPKALNATTQFVLPKSIISGYAVMTLHISYTHANNGALTLTCTSIDNSGGTTEYTPTTCVSIAGTCNLQDAGIYVTAELTGNKNYVVPVGILGFHDMKCTLAHGGTPNASDTVTIDGWLVTEQ